jgi:hypothetical protein
MAKSLVIVQQALVPCWQREKNETGREGGLFYLVNGLQAGPNRVITVH